MSDGPITSRLLSQVQIIILHTIQQEILEGAKFGVLIAIRQSKKNLPFSAIMSMLIGTKPLIRQTKTHQSPKFIPPKFPAVRYYMNLFATELE